MIVDDLVQGPVGRNLSIVGCSDMLDVNFFVGHRFCRCCVLSPLRHRLFTRGGALSPVWAAPFDFEILSAPTGDDRGKIGYNWKACVARLHFRNGCSAVSSDRIGLLKIDGCGSHESTSGTRSIPATGPRDDASSSQIGGAVGNDAVH